MKESIALLLFSFMMLPQYKKKLPVFMECPYKQVQKFIEILADLNLCKCLKAIKCSESRDETLQIFSFPLTINFMQAKIG